MQDTRASIAIFHSKATYPEGVSQPIVPSEVFKVAQQIIEDGTGCQVVRAKDGVYVVSHSLTGPFTEHVGNEWLPVHIMRLEQWCAGGIKKSEMDNFLSQET